MNKTLNTPVDTQGSNTGQHTPGEIYINCPIDDDGNDIIKTNPQYGNQEYFVLAIKNSFDIVGFLYPHSKQSHETMKANTERIVECWNGYDKLQKELAGMYALNREGWQKVEAYEKMYEQTKEANRELIEALNKSINDLEGVKKGTNNSTVRILISKTIEQSQQVLSKHNK